MTDSISYPLIQEPVRDARCELKALIDENNTLKKELAQTKQLLQEHINFSKIMSNFRSPKKLLVPSKTLEINSLSDCHKQVLEIMFKFFTIDKKSYSRSLILSKTETELRLQNCNFIQELVKCGYCITDRVINSDEIPEHWNNPQTMISPLLKYIILQDYIRSDDFFMFQELIELVKPTADLNIKYDKFGTILDYFRRLHLTQSYNFRVYGTGSRILSTLDSIIYYLETVGAK
jgi:hypothetical protein